MLRTRVISALVFVPVFLAAIYLSGWWLLGMCLLVAAAALYEYFSLAAPSLMWDRLWGMALGLALALLLMLDAPAALHGMLLPATVLIASTVVVLRPVPLEAGITRSAAMVFGALYGGVLVSFLYKLRQGPDGLFWAMAALFAVWGSDTGAYFTGRWLGRHKLASTLSPKKTVEGFVGGVLSAIAVALLAWWLFSPAVPLVAAVCVGGVAGVCGPLGDLTESLLKRSAGAKDSGWLLPGHGGVLDRFDGVIFVAPIVYLVRLAVTALI